jgi:hypothetical protein
MTLESWMIIPSNIEGERLCRDHQVHVVSDVIVASVLLAVKFVNSVMTTYEKSIIRMQAAS